MTIEDKARKYDEALSRAKAWIENRCMPSDTNRQGVLEDIFPELKKSEDSDVLGALLDYFKRYNTCGATTFNGIPADKILAWLKKQDEQKPKFVAKKEVTGVLKELLDNIDPVELEETRKEMMESMPTDKDEPKFKVGDWIIDKNDGTIMKIINNKGFYESVEIGGQRRTDTYNYVEWGFRLWTIEDAKDGDVLCDYHETYDNPLIFILKKFEHVNFGLVRPSDYSSYCFLTACDIQRFKEGTYHHEHNIKPATKEQRDLLFSKMEEAGYEFDWWNKELKKLHVIGEGKDEMDYCFTKMMNGEKVSSAWSKEDDELDEELITAAICFIDSYNNDNGFACNGIYKGDVLKWLKSLKQRIKE